VLECTSICEENTLPEEPTKEFFNECYNSEGENNKMKLEECKTCCNNKISNYVPKSAISNCKSNCYNK